MNDSLRCPKCACPNNKVLHTDTMQYPRALIIKRKRCCRYCKHVWTTTEKQLSLPQPITPQPQLLEPPFEQEIDDHGSNGKPSNPQPSTEPASVRQDHQRVSTDAGIAATTGAIREYIHPDHTQDPSQSGGTQPLTSKQRKALKRKETKQRRKLESLSPEVLPIPVNPAPREPDDATPIKIPTNPYLPQQ